MTTLPFRSRSHQPGTRRFASAVSCPTPNSGAAPTSPSGALGRTPARIEPGQVSSSRSTTARRCVRRSRPGPLSAGRRGDHRPRPRRGRAGPGDRVRRPVGVRDDRPGPGRQPVALAARHRHDRLRPRSRRLALPPGDLRGGWPPRRRSCPRSASRRSRRGRPFLASSLTSMVDRRFDLAILSFSPDSLAKRAADGLVLDAALIGSGRFAGLFGRGRSAMRRSGRWLAWLDASGRMAHWRSRRETASWGCSPVPTLRSPRDLRHRRTRRRASHHRGSRCRRDAVPAASGSIANGSSDCRRMAKPRCSPPLGAAALARDYGASDGAIVAGLESVTRNLVRRLPVATVAARPDPN